MKIATVQVETSLKSNPVAAGSAFLAKSKNKYFLVTNYHVLTGRKASDTTIIKDPTGRIPDSVIVYFHPQKGNQNVKITYPLIDKKNNWRFLRFPVDHNSKWVIDISILPISKPVGNIEISPIDINQIDTEWIVKPNTKLYVLGFPRLVNLSDIYPETIFLNSLPGRDFNYRDRYILAPTHFDFEGASGSPVYRLSGGKYTFIARVVGSTGKGKNDPENKEALITSCWIKELFKLWY